MGDPINGDLVLGPLGLGVTFILLALAAWLFASSRKDKARLPSGKIIYTDTGTWLEQEDVLFSPVLQLVGRPDYLVEGENGDIIPVEVKSSPAPKRPHEAHVFQLAAYCLLVEDAFGIRPSHGILQYQDSAFGIDFTEGLEDDLLDLLADMREDMFEEEIHRDHNDRRRCIRCGVMSFCNQRLS